MDTNFEHYKVFYYVAKYENLTKAASVLKTSQPAVTRTIAMPCMPLGMRTKESCSRKPAKTTIAKAKPMAVEKA